MTVVSSNTVVTEVISAYIERTRVAGGFIHPDLRFICEPSPKGVLSLAGVTGPEFCLHVPLELCFQINKNTTEKDFEYFEWAKVWKALGYDINHKRFLFHRHFEGLIAPLADMVNDCGKGGPSWSAGGDGVKLYGSEVRY